MTQAKPDFKFEFNKPASLPINSLKGETGSNIKNETWGSDSYLLWKNETKSKSLYPAGLFEINHVNKNYNNFKNHFFGYSFNFPKAWEVDTHQTPYYTRFYTKDFRLDITVQDVTKAWTSPYGYISNTIENIQENITNDTRWNQIGLQIRRVDYNRPIIKGIVNDMNYYSYYFIIKHDNVYTLQVKTSESNFESLTKQITDLISNFSLIGKKDFDLNTLIKNADLNSEIIYKHNNKSLVIKENEFLMGAYLTKPREIENLNNSLNTHLGLQMFYKPIDSDYDLYVTELLEQSRLPMVTFLFERANKENHHDVIPAILNGEFDGNLLNWSEGVQKTEGPVLLRLGNEMNGSWSDWSHKYSYNDPDLYKLSFKYIVELFKRSGTSNAYFVWNPNNVSSPYYEWNNAAMYYPGDKYVDLVGITSYNFGKTQYNDFRYFETLYDDLYWDYSRSYFGKPLMIGEFGSVENGGDKGKWISEMFELVPEKYTNIKMAVWFDEAHGEYDLRIKTSDNSFNSFKNGMQNQNVVKYLMDGTK